MAFYSYADKFNLIVH